MLDVGTDGFAMPLVDCFNCICTLTALMPASEPHILRTKAVSSTTPRASHTWLLRLLCIFLSTRYNPLSDASSAGHVLWAVRSPARLYPARLPGKTVRTIGKRSSPCGVTPGCIQTENSRRI